MDPARIVFMTVARRANFFDDDDDACKGCLFEKERTTVCHAATAEALKRGLRDCDDGFIYVAAKVDPRQIDLFETPEAAPGTDAQHHKEIP